MLLISGDEQARRALAREAFLGARLHAKIIEAAPEDPSMWCIRANFFDIDVAYEVHKEVRRGIWVRTKTILQVPETVRVRDLSLRIKPLAHVDDVLQRLWSDIGDERVGQEDLALHAETDHVRNLCLRWFMDWRLAAVRMGAPGPSDRYYTSLPVSRVSPPRMTCSGLSGPFTRCSKMKTLVGVGMSASSTSNPF